MMRAKAMLALAAGAMLSAEVQPTIVPAPIVVSSLGADYKPLANDERGLWMQAEEYERSLSTSNFVIRDPALNTYVRSVFCRTVGEEQCRPIRIYIMRTASFNAAMSPNGALQVWSGLLLRLHNEAQLAAVLGHEYVHYANLHSVKQFRDLKNKTNAIAWLGFVPFGFVASLGVAGSLFGFSRNMETEADAGSVVLMAKAGYDPMEASRMWEQLRAEMDATAAARNRKSRKDRDHGMFETHPPTAERVTALAARARATSTAGTPIVDRTDYEAALAPWWPELIDDQIKLNDFGGTEMLLAGRAADGWTGPLLYARGELYRSRGRPEDLQAAATFYGEATSRPDAPIEAWRGLGLTELRLGNAVEGRAALRAYLARRPDASDQAMMTMLAQGDG